MDIELVVIGKTQNRYITEGINEYLKRLKRYIPYKITIISDVRNSGRLSQSEQKTAEGEQILSRISSSDYVVLLDEHGKEYTSIEFASKLERWMACGKKRLLFIVGGPYGFSQAVYNRSDHLMSLSRLTFNHEMVRLFFTEQIYRAMTILRNEPYHHE